MYLLADGMEDRIDSMNLRWGFPVNSTDGVITILKNSIFTLGYIQKHKCNKKAVDYLFEQEIYPFISELKDEYDLMLSTVLFCVIRHTKNYTDIETEMKFAYDILSSIINTFQALLKSNMSKEVICDDSEMIFEVDTSKLQVGQVVKNYKELCNILGMPIYKSGSNQDKAQKKLYKRYFEWEKTGQKIVVLDIYDEPLESGDARQSGNRNIYLKYIESILLKYVYHKKGQVCYITKNQLWTILGMINSNYKKIPWKVLQNEDEYLDISKWEFDKFYMRCSSKLNSILYGALRNLDNRSLIKWEIQTMIVIPDTKGKMSNHYVANDNEIRRILAVERKVLKEMGFESKNHVACCMKLQEFYSKVNSELYDLYGWERKYERIKIIFNSEDIKEEIPRNEYKLQMMMISDLIVEAMDNNAQTMVDNRYKKALKEYEDYVTGYFGKPPKLEEIDDIFTYPKYFVDIQRKLSQKFLSVRYAEQEKEHKAKKIHTYDKELDELFNVLGREN